MKLIKLTQGKFAQVDDEDFEQLNKYTWHASKGFSTYYAVRLGPTNRGYRPFLIMHRIIMGVDDPKLLVDHIDHNGLNNQKSNLRICTKSQNGANRKPSGSSKYLGVCKKVLTNRVYRKKTNDYKEYVTIRWDAKITHKGKVQYIGVFPYTPEGEIEAAKAYDEKAKEIHGEFANLNFK